MVNFVEIFAGAAAFSTVVAAGGYGGYGSPSYEAEKPHYEAEKPHYEAEKPEYQPKEPAYEAPKPEYKPEEPSYEGPKYGPGYQPGYPTKSYYPTTMRTTTIPATTTTATTSTTTTTSATTTTTTVPVVPTPYNIYIGNVLTDAITEFLPAIGDAAFVANDAELAQDLLTFGNFLDTDVTADVFISSPNPETGDDSVLFDSTTSQFALANVGNQFLTTTEGETAYYVFFADAADAVAGEGNLFVTVAQDEDDESLDLRIAFPLGDGIASINVLSVCPGESLDEVLVISTGELVECTRVQLNYVDLVGDDN
ncbi:hypothetical protein CB0940_11357 [Cercospora beticola]|uniref:Uncharacterized protein n=1 Tax=Cercospora beticola TaxID=122368 RepID=A0A2G5HDP8_CERBT|nr:hypothetical protein CB0940_11357 [Cercospora beticola]PIA90661.1 hypothetical protein CB0940_11357 [Cercospora beticola]WPB08197.1 hypothetical protein RHO25_012861 [Cercospora beticola]